MGGASSNIPDNREVGIRDLKKDEGDRKIIHCMQGIRIMCVNLKFQNKRDVEVNRSMTYRKRELLCSSIYS